MADTISDDFSTTASLLPNSSASSNIDGEGDYDWWRIDLVAGTTYTFDLLGLASAEGTLEDPYLELLTSTGSLLDFDDDSGPGDLESQIVFTAETSGTYFLAASDALETETGSYTIVATSESSGPGEGAFEVSVDGTPTNGANAWIDSLVWGGAWDDGDGGTVTIVWHATDDAYPWESYELTALRQALAAWEAVANIDFVESDPESAESADIWYWSEDDIGLDGALGIHEVPGDSSGEPLYGQFNWEAAGWGPIGLLRGGNAFITLLHEIGHGLGLAHPHDGGAQEDATVFPGVTDEFDDFGTSSLNQGIFTTMSYNDGWLARFPGHVSASYGGQATPMALDIAAIQAIYGANTTYNPVANTYTLPTANKSGTFWSCIWDTGGTDAINAGPTTASCTINLNAAPLTGANAGGYVSSVTNIVGGFTIANGVVIENATGGAGSDLITGNAVRNVLSGGNGNDTINGGNGNDAITGGGGADRILGGVGNDTVTWGAGDSVDGGGGLDTLKLQAALNLLTLQNKVLGTEQIDMRGGGAHTLKLNRADVLELSTTTNNIKVFGDSGDKIDIDGSFTRGAVSGAFRTYNLAGGALLTVETDVTVI
jgi:serralysin